MIDDLDGHQSRIIIPNKLIFSDWNSGMSHHSNKMSLALKDDKLYYRIRKPNTKQELEIARGLLDLGVKVDAVNNLLAKQRGELPYSEEEYNWLKISSDNGNDPDDIDWNRGWAK